MAKGKSRRRQFRELLVNSLQSIPHDGTRRQYIRNVNNYAEWVYDNWYCSTVEEAREHVQDYVLWLQVHGMSASTIHTYVAAICRSLKLPMSSVEKPIRHTAQNTRGRSFADTKKRNDNDMSNPEWQRLVDFQRIVGIRRAELKSLKKRDLLINPYQDGYDYIFVRSGKGGRQQYQRLIYTGDTNRNYIRSYFAGDPNDCVFERQYIDGNSLSLHSLRADVAKRAYDYYLSKLRTDPGYREQLVRAVERQWDMLHNQDGRSTALPRNRVEGRYFLRGKNRVFAIAHGLPVSYDRLAVMAVSELHLAHHRLDVTINNYLLAI